MIKSIVGLCDGTSILGSIHSIHDWNPMYDTEYTLIEKSSHVVTNPTMI